MENHTNPASEPVRPTEYATLPADDYREMIQAAYEPRIPATPGQRVGQTAQTTASFASFGLLVAGCGWAGVKALNFLEEKRLARQLRKLQAEHELVIAKGTATAPPK